MKSDVVILKSDITPPLAPQSERGHVRDLRDVRSMLDTGLIRKDRLRELFDAIEPEVIRYPAIDPASFRAVVAFCESSSQPSTLSPQPPDEADVLLAGLPGEQLVRHGLTDAAAGRCTVPVCLVAISLPRMRRAGLVSYDWTPPQEDVELELYRLLCKAGGDAYLRYNALIRELVSFEQALDGRLSRKAEISNADMLNC